MAKKIPTKGQIWHTNGDPTSGREFKGSHYYLVISDEKLNKPLGTAIAVPITSAGKLARSSGVTVILDGASTDKGIVTGCVLCHQLRTLDLEARNASYSSSVTPEILDEVIGKIIDIIDPT
ncbi:type II toxin-antitoxin system PemK/MazF family toxin [Xenorhabdus bovienii]|uniref:type II toxin-antitoxin system PemK/MazF family toxin n=1 Tax=Xenorhabdus bovienii TaxID=40576 RepID=UPI0023B276C6|nr:type II toxin-antitoxin system PemK/MazF family toxin [Xenorhabdus bovienii]MDE9544123.1 type II toxin-antitoxin system PemK/MazF family toxin [Xenorhabdus bovienii]